MAAFIAPALGAAGQVAGAALGGKGASKAAQSQERTATRALQFQRELEAQRKANFERGLSVWDASRRMLAERYGLDPTNITYGMSASGYSPGTARAVPGATMARPAPGIYQPQAPAMGGQPAGPSFIEELPGSTIGDLLARRRA